MNAAFDKKLDLRGPVETCLEAAITLTGAQRGNIQLLDEATGTFKIFAQRGFDKPFLEYFASVSADSASVCGAALRAGKRIVIEDVLESPLFRGTSSLQVLLDAKVRAVQSTPLLSRSGRIAGVLSTHFEWPHHLSAMELQVLDVLARQATDLLEWFAAEKALMESEQRLRALNVALEDRVNQRTCELSELLEQTRHQAQLLDAANDAIFVRDRHARIIYWNKGAERLYGWTKEEATGKSTRELLKTEFSSSVEEIVKQSQHGGWEGELVHTTKDGRRLNIASRWTPLKNEQGDTSSWLTTNSDITPRKQVEEMARELSARLLKMQDDERRRIARELHDSAGQNLAALAINLDQLALKARLNEEQTGLLSESAQIVRDITKEIRTISHLLHPPLLDEVGLSSALGWYIEGFQQRSGIQTTLDLPPQFGRLSQDAEVAFFRVVQECLTNVHRHSGSQTALVRLRRTAADVKLEVADEGSGNGGKLFDASGQNSMGVGLRGMRERIAQLGGDLQVQFGEKGTVVRAILPMARNMSAAPSAKVRQEVA